LGKKQVLPKREISSAKEFFEAFPEAREIFIDGTERPIRRPRDNEAQRQSYSGKKKRHAKKNIVIRGCGKELSADEKEQNRSKSRIRILVENALAGVKRLRIVSDIYRNRVKDFDDRVMLISSGLWNYHLT
jgi:hypothetical protein